MPAMIHYPATLVLFGLLLTGCSAQQPRLSLSQTIIGCGNFHIYALTEERTAYVYVSQPQAALNPGENSYMLGKETMMIEYVLYDGPVGNVLCNDVRGLDVPSELARHQSIDGMCKMTLTEENFKLYQQGGPYEIEVELSDVLFSNEIKLDHYTGKVVVGWKPG